MRCLLGVSASVGVSAQEGVYPGGGGVWPGVKTLPCRNFVADGNNANIHKFTVLTFVRQPELFKIPPVIFMPIRFQSFPLLINSNW